MRICEPLSTKASPSLGINNDVYGPWNDMHCVQWCVSEGQDEGNVAVGLWVVGFGLLCECQWVGVRHSWLVVSVGTAWLWSCSHLLRSVCGTFPLSAPGCSAAQWLWLPLYTQVCRVLLMIYCEKLHGTAVWRGEDWDKHKWCVLWGV